MKICIVSKGQGELLRYAKQELTHFLEQYSNHQVGEYPDADREIVLECGSALEEGTLYRLTGGCREGKPVLTIAGGTENGVLAGVYDALERMGLCFQMNGPVCEGLLDVSACDGVTFESEPFCRHRGIRQHINFPMDISSYHLEDAGEYIRNLARMGLNSITFHSYTGQWHGYETEKRTVYAGNYFHGQRHLVPDYPPIAERVDNRLFYCIPEIERQLTDPKLRHEFSIQWLNGLMKVCKQVGMTVTLSIELPGDEPVENLVKIVRGVLRDYPLIDMIEWISPEGGGDGENFPLEELENRVRDYFGDRPFVDGKLPYVPDTMPKALPGAMDSLKRAVDLYRRKDEILAGMAPKRIAIGLYVMSKETLRVLKNIMVSVLPEEVLLTFLPAHGSVAVAKNIEFMRFTEAELQRTMIYSWIEFDGNMYLQQNGNRGIELLLKQTAETTGGKSVYGMCFNHWRTEENELVVGYLAKASVRFETSEAYYRDCARAMGIPKRELFAEAMLALEDIDCFARDRLFNIGFSYVGCWLTGKLSWISDWAVADLHEAVARYEAVGEKLACCLEDTESIHGVARLRFLMNRIGCSVIHVKEILELKAIRGIVEGCEPENLTPEQKEQVARRCEQAMAYCRDYENLHLRQMADRGCQGTVVSYDATMPLYIEDLRQVYVCGNRNGVPRPDSYAVPAPDKDCLN